MKILDFRYTEWLLSPTSPREFDLGAAGLVIIRTAEFGDIEIWLDKGFHTNGRSGTLLADLFIPHLGRQALLSCWVAHDALGHGLGISFGTINDFLDQMLEIAGETDLKSDIVEAAVSVNDDWFGCKTEKERINRDRINLQWVPRSRHWGDPRMKNPKPTKPKSRWNRFWDWVW